MQKKTDKHSISDMMNEKELLEWYLAAGVDAICGDVPGCLQQKAPPRERPTAGRGNGFAAGNHRFGADES